MGAQVRSRQEDMDSIQTVSYPEHGNDDCFTVEDSSFWFRHRNRCITQLVANFRPPKDTILDVGGGNGFVSRALQDAGFETTLLEPGPAGVRNARSRGVRSVVEGKLDESSFAPNTIPSIGLFDVLEHIEADEAFLELIHSRLIPAGKLYITVPAYNWLWSHEDVHAGHFRRYTLCYLRKMLAKSLFKVEFASYMFCILPPAVFLLRSIPYRLGFSGAPSARMASDHRNRGFLGASLSAELKLLQKGISLPMGGSCLVAAAKLTKVV